MSGIHPLLQVAGAALLVVLVVGTLAWRRWVIRSRIRDYVGGELPETLTFGVIYYGSSAESGRLRKREGALLATAEALVFMDSGLKGETVVMPWSRLAGWEVVGKFREWPIHSKIVSVRVTSELGAPVDQGFAIPRPEFWTSLIDVAMKSPKKGETS